MVAADHNDDRYLVTPKWGYREFIPVRDGTQSNKPTKRPLPIPEVRAVRLADSLVAAGEL
jgi:hypothetical protein